MKGWVVFSRLCTCDPRWSPERNVYTKPKEMPSFDRNRITKSDLLHLPGSLKSSVYISENKARKDIKTESKRHYYRNPLCKWSTLTPKRLLMLLRSRTLCGWKISNMRFGLGFKWATLLVKFQAFSGHSGQNLDYNQGDYIILYSGRSRILGRGGPTSKKAHLYIYRAQTEWVYLYGPRPKGVWF